METKHTPEPWTVLFAADRDDGDDIADTQIISTVGCPYSHIATVHYGNEGSDHPGYVEHGANATRIVACINACAGINPEALPDLLAACELLVYRVECQADGDQIGPEDIAEARAAIAKATGSGDSAEAKP